MSTTEYAGKLDELDRLLNDPDVPMQPDRVWSLLADLARLDMMMPRPVQTAVTPAVADR